jgi:integrase
MSAVPQVRSTVGIWELQRRSGACGVRWVVRWRVGSRQFSRSFRTKKPAEKLRSALIVADDDGRRFHPQTGFPRGWNLGDTSAAEWARIWFDEQRPTWTPRSRKSACDVLTVALVHLVHPEAPAPPPKIHRAIRRWLAAPADNAMPDYLARHSARLADLDAHLCETAAHKMQRRQDGRLYAATTLAKQRHVMNPLLDSAVRRQLLEENLWPAPNSKRASQKVDHTVDIKMLPSLEEAARCVAQLRNHQPSSIRYSVLCSLILWAGLRPSEARAVRVEDLTLPPDGARDRFGEVRVRQASRYVGRLWGDEEEDLGDPKAQSNRDVPLPPCLVAVLREYLDGRTTGWLFPGEDDEPARLDNLDRAWRRVRTRSSMKPYDLRHVAATGWLIHGMAPSEVARRLGHSVDTLMRHYVDLMDGDCERGNAAVLAWTAGADLALLDAAS